MKKYKSLYMTVLCLVILSIILKLTANILPWYYRDLKFGLLTFGLFCGMIGILLGIILFVAAIFTKNIWFLIRVFATILICFWSVFILRNFGVIGSIPYKILHVRADFKHLAKAIERYHNDNHKYPPWARGEKGVNGFAGEGTGAYKMHTFAIGTLTTPIKYIESYPQDPFSDTRDATYGYYTDGGGFILYSWGPDTDESNDERWDLETDVEKVYDSKIPQPSTTLLTGKSSAPKGGAYTYDPSNGTVSEGDIYLVK